MFTDTHAHLNFDPFYQDVEPYIERAKAAGVTRIVIPSADIPSLERAIELAERFDGLYAAVGVHPQDCLKAPNDYLRVLESMIAHPKVVAIGEIGLDYYRDYAPRDIQQRVFKEQVQLAKAHQIPMIVHNRNADQDTYDILDTTDYFNVQFHCYGSDEVFAKKILEKGALISFTGVVTFAKSVPELVKALPLEKLMIETDCPWMAPVPYRGKRNEPAYVIEVAKAYGHIFDLPLDEIARITTNTALKFFGIK